MSVTARENSDIVVADCLASDGVGAMVRTVGILTDGKYQVETCDPSDRNKMPASGMLIHKMDSTTGLVQFRGIVREVYAGLVPGEILFVDDSGGLANLPPDPSAGDHKFMQSVGVAISDNIIELKPSGVMARKGVS